jgi:hypothetical protein
LGEVTDVGRGDDDPIAGAADRDRAGRQQHVGIKSIRRGRRRAAIAGLGLKCRGLSPFRRRDRDIHHAARQDQVFEAAK